jgi:hypothetical protein
MHLRGRRAHRAGARRWRRGAGLGIGGKGGGGGGGVGRKTTRSTRQTPWCDRIRHGGDRPTPGSARRCMPMDAMPDPATLKRRPTPSSTRWGGVGWAI